MQLAYNPYDDLSVETRIQILHNAIEFLEVRFPGGDVAIRLRDRKLEQIRQLEALQDVR
jgi:hypothetical protein